MGRPSRRGTEQTFNIDDGKFRSRIKNKLGHCMAHQMTHTGGADPPDHFRPLTVPRRRGFRNNTFATHASPPRNSTTKTRARELARDVLCVSVQGRVVNTRQIGGRDFQRHMMC